MLISKRILWAYTLKHTHTLVYVYMSTRPTALQGIKGIAAPVDFSFQLHSEHLTIYYQLRNRITQRIQYRTHSIYMLYMLYINFRAIKSMAFNSGAQTGENWPVYKAVKHI